MLHATVRRSAATVALAALLCSGCQVGPFAATPDRDHGVAAFQFADIPVPEGMKLLDQNHDSHSSEAGDWRYGHFIYVGTPSVDRVSDYMMQRMPQHAWKLASEEVPTPESRVLKFERGIYAVECRFTRESATTRMVVDYRTVANQR